MRRDVTCPRDDRKTIGDDDIASEQRREIVAHSYCLSLLRSPPTGVVVCRRPRLRWHQRQQQQQQQRSKLNIVSRRYSSRRISYIHRRRRQYS